MSPAMCEKAKGLMLCAGPRDRFERTEPALTRMTGEVWWVGERADLAAVHKLFGNAMIAAIVILDRAPVGRREGRGRVHRERVRVWGFPHSFQRRWRVTLLAREDPLGVARAA